MEFVETNSPFIRVTLRLIGIRKEDVFILLAIDSSTRVLVAYIIESEQPRNVIKKVKSGIIWDIYRESL